MSHPHGSGEGQASGPSPSQQARPPLNVKDALTYLDSVKAEFSIRPEIYNDFLDIMKDFKTQSIDTPGVIDRVSTLFRGYPSLIQGFNTFLPPGYRIEADEHSDIITVTTPTGTTTRSVSGVPLEPSASQQSSHSQPPPPPPQGPHSSQQQQRHHSQMAHISHSPASSHPHQPHSHPHPPSHHPGSAASSASHSQPASAPAPTAPAPAPSPTPPPHSTGHHHPGAPSPAPASSTPTPTQQQQQQQQPPPPPPPPPPQTSRSTGYQSQQRPTSHTSSPAPASQIPPQQQQQHPHPPPHPQQSQQQQQQQQQPPPPPPPPPPPQHQQQHPPPPTGPPPQHMTQMDTPGSGANTPQQQQRPPLEFGHAISYVNRIKNRFTSDPDTYKTFLEILQNYQREQRPIQDVYAKVTALFHNAPDLLDEFKQFLPDNSGPEGAAAAMMYDGAAAAAAAAAAASTTAPPSSTVPPPETAPYQEPVATPKQMSKKKSEQGTGNKPGPRGGQGKRTKDAAGGTPTQGSEQPAKKAKRTKGNQAPSSPPPPQLMDGVPPNLYSHGPPGAHPAPPPPPPPPSSLPPPGSYPVSAPFILPPRLYGLPSQTLTTAEEAGFFDLAKRHIDDRNQYSEFLKFLELYSNGIIETSTLVDKAYQFLGKDDDLFTQFKELVGWDPNTDGLVQGEEWFIQNENALDRPRFEMSHLPSHGPSYRKLPETEIDLACSGRDPLCWSVLNDSWVAYATWASEGSGSHKKNPYEDAMAACEQERHYYDHIIESAIRTLAVLEPIAERISRMTPEEKTNFKLQPGFGHNGRSIYERTIKKLYNSEGNRGEHGYEVLKHLYTNPATAVPIVLNRLRNKTDEWRRNQREWNKVWRHVDLKNHYRSLDHQALHFKTNEKKAMTSKTFLNEIEQLRDHGKQKRTLPSSTHHENEDQVSGVRQAALLHSKPSRNQYEFSFLDVDVMYDILKLVLTYLDRVHGQYSRPERERVETCLRDLFSLVFLLSENEINEKLAPYEAAVAAAQAAAAAAAANESGDEALNGDTAAATANAAATGGASTNTANNNNNNNNEGDSSSTSTSAGNGGANDTDMESETEGGPTESTTAGGEDSSVTANGTHAKNVSGKKGADDLRRRLLSSVVEQDRKREDSGSATPYSASSTPGHVNGESPSESPSTSRGPSPPGSDNGKTGDESSSTIHISSNKKANSLPERRHKLRSSVLETDSGESTWSLIEQLDPSHANFSTAGGRTSMTASSTAAAFSSSSASASNATKSRSKVNSSSNNKRKLSNIKKSPNLHSESIQFVKSLPDNMGGGIDGRRYNFFCNSTFYYLARILHTLYFRLSSLKNIAAQYSTQESFRRLNPLSVDLGLAAPLPIIDDGENPAKQYYEHMLDLCERLFDQEIEQSAFEDNLRYMFGIKAFPMFTVDRMISSIIKHIHTINSDSTCQDLVAMLMKDRSREDHEITVRQQIAYRMLAETLVGQDDNLFRIEWRPDTQMLSIQLMLPEDATLEHPKTAYEEWVYYVNSYMLRSGTESVGSKARSPFMSRRHHIAEMEDQHFQTIGDSDMRMQISPKYKLTFGDNTGFYMATKSLASKELLDKAKQSYARRSCEWKEWVEERVTGKQASTSRSSSNSTPAPASSAASATGSTSQLLQDETKSADNVPATNADENASSSSVGPTAANDAATVTTSESIDPPAATSEPVTTTTQDSSNKPTDTPNDEGAMEIDEPETVAHVTEEGKDEKKEEKVDEEEKTVKEEEMQEREEGEVEETQV